MQVHCEDLKDKPFFLSLIDYMASGPIVAMVWHEPDAVKQGRTLFGATNPLASAPGTISGDFTIQTGCSVYRGSNFIDFVNRETAHWFKFDEINNYTNVQIGNKVYE